jgi:hypothetical protein
MYTNKNDQYGSLTTHKCRLTQPNPGVHWKCRIFLYIITPIGFLHFCFCKSVINV